LLYGFGVVGNEESIQGASVARYHAATGGFFLLLMVVASFAEVVSVGEVLPFLAALTNPEQLYEYVLTKRVLFSGVMLWLLFEVLVLELMRQKVLWRFVPLDKSIF